MYNYFKNKYFFITELFILLSFANVEIFADSGVQHPDPKNDSLIPITGWPFYVENLEIGTPISDYGSHFGVKATVDNDGDNYPKFDSPNRIDAKNFLNMAHYATITSFNGQVDQSYFWFKETSPKIVEHLKPAVSRSIQFSPYGWTESAEDLTLSATGNVVTLATDTFLFYLTVKNNSSGSITLTPVLTIEKDHDPQSESPPNPGSTFESCENYSIGSNIATIECSGTRSSKQIKFVRAIKSSENVQNVNYTSGYKFDLELISISLAPGEAKEIYLVIGYVAEGDAVNDAKALAISGADRVESNSQKASGVINEIKSEWDVFFQNLPVPHVTSSNYSKIFRMAATGLRMNLYKKRNAMPADCSVPGKVHFNFFWAWDTPFHTLGQSEWDIQLAKDNLTTQFAGQGEDGIIYMVIDDYLKSPIKIFTQPPAQGWAIKKIAEMDGFKDNDWLQSMFLKSKSYLNYWESVRDNDGDGLYEFSSGLETGWDDTPRFHCPKNTNLCGAITDKIDSVDLNSWLYIYYNSMEKIAEKLGLPSDKDEFKKKAELLSKNIEEKLWDEDAGAYFDRELKDSGEHEFIKVLTPAIAFPLFAGAVKNSERAKRVIEEHILNPDEFWGKYPVPTVAYNAPEYDHDDDGYYWQGQIWLMTAYSTLTALYKYGYEKEAEELRTRLLDMIATADPGGIHETYDALTDKVGWGAGSNGYSGGVGEPSVFQFGWSSAFIMETILQRYQRDRFLMPDDKKITGFIKEITNIKDGSKYISIESNSYEVPKTILESGSESPIVDSKSIYLKLEDPYNVFGSPETNFKIYLNFNAKIGAVSQEDNSVNWINIESDSDGNYFSAKLTNETTGIKYYLIMPQEEGCGCTMESEHNNGFIGFVLVLVISGALFFFTFDLSKKF